MDKDKLDIIISVATINFYSLGKEFKKIELIGFNPKDKKHLGLLHTALIGQKVFNYSLYLDMGIFEFIKFNLKNKKFMKVKRLKNKTKDYPSCNEFISNICLMNEYENAFEDIYNEYYLKGEKILIDDN